MSSRPGHSEPRRLVLLDPALLPRAERILGPGVRAWKVPPRAGGRERILIELPPSLARRIREDPVLGSLRIQERIEGLEALEPLPLERGRFPEPALLPAGDDAPLRARLEVCPQRRPLAGAPWDAPQALWISSALVPRFLAYLEGAPPSVWEAFRIHEARDGIVARGPVPSRRKLAARGLALAVPLHGGESRAGHALHIEHGALAPALRDLVATEGDTLIRIDLGRIVCERIGPAMAAGDILRHASTAVEAIPWPGGGDPPPADLRSREAAVKLFVSLGEARKGDAERRRAFEGAFVQPSTRRGESDREAGRIGGWLRRFLPRKLDEALRRRLDLASRQRLADPVERARIIAKQRDAIGHLLESLSREGWREALSLALPLRPPSEVESGSVWLHAGDPPQPMDPRFDLERAAWASTGGVFGVGPRVHAQLQFLYRRAGEALVAARDFRRAAHVFSYLLGDHLRAAAVLEQGEFFREAATVYYHLAQNPQRAAVALDRGGLYDEAARIWMDLLRWPEAARAWSRAGDAAQARAAWRRVALDLEANRRMLEAADVLERELGEPEAARAVLERCAMACDPESIVALERCARAWVAAGEEERAAGIFARARARFEWVALEGTSRATLALLVDLARRAATWRPDDPIRRAAGEDAARSTWVSAATAWARARGRVPAALRREMDARILRAAKAGPDPWLTPDAGRWLRGLDPEARPREAIAVEEVRLGSRTTSLAARADTLLLGFEDGSLALLKEGRLPTTRLETGSRKPILALASSKTDIYSATEDEVHHFRDAPMSSATPAHIERTLPFTIRSMVLFPGAGLVVIGSRNVQLLHASHLASLATVNMRDGDLVVDGCGNRRLAALLVRPAGSTILEAHILQRRETRGIAFLRTVERLPLRPGSWRRIAFTGPDGDDFVVIGDDTLVLYPSRREQWRSIDLQVSSAALRFPPARVLAVPGREALLLAYGEGSLERLDPGSGERGILLEGPENLDPLVGFACRGKAHGDSGPAWTAWLLHESGLLRSARGAGTRT